MLLVETFVDPNRFRGTCYKAAGWEALGQTQGYARCGQDFYLDTQHPKELWVRPLKAAALEQLGARELPPELTAAGPALPPLPPVKTPQMESMWQYARHGLTDPRSPKGVRHPITSLVCIATLAVAAGCQGPHAIAEFAKSLNRDQRRRLRCPPGAAPGGSSTCPVSRLWSECSKSSTRTNCAKSIRAGWPEWIPGRSR